MEHLTVDGKLDNKLLEAIAIDRFDNMVKERGLRETIRLAYGDVGCHPDIQAPRMRKEGIVWGPIYRIDGNHIEKGCSDFRRWPWTSTSFEMKFAHEFLEKDKNYMCADSDWRGGLYLPVSDYTLPVYSRYGGKMHSLVNFLLLKCLIVFHHVSWCLTLYPRSIAFCSFLTVSHACTYDVILV